MPETGGVLEVGETEDGGSEVIITNGGLDSRRVSTLEPDSSTGRREVNTWKA